MRAILPILALAALSAGAGAQVHNELNLSNGNFRSRGSGANNRFGQATVHTLLPPRTGAEVWTSKLAYVAWSMDTTTSAGTDHDVYFTRSIDGGQSWEAPRRIDQQLGNAQEVHVVADKHNVFVSWESNEITTDEDIYCAVSTDQGQTFQGPFLINDPLTQGMGDVDEHESFAAGDYGYFTWEFDDRGRTAGTGDEDTHFNSFHVDPVTGNITVGSDRMVSNPGAPLPEDVDSPVITADPTNGDVAVLWFDDRGGVTGANALYCVTSRVNGSDFPLPVDIRIAGPPTADLRARNHVEAVISGGYLHMLWEDRRFQASGGFDEPFYNRLDMSNFTLLHPGDLRVDDWVVPGGFEMDNIVIAVDTANPNNVACAWHDDRDNGGGSNNRFNDGFITISNDGGQTFGPNVRMSANSGPGTFQRNEIWGVSWRGDHILVVGERSENNTSTNGLTLEDTVVFMSQNSGNTWSEILLTDIGSTNNPPSGIGDIDNPYMVTSPARNDIVITQFNDFINPGFNDLTVLGLRVPYIEPTADIVSGATVQIQVKQIGESNAGGFAFMFYNMVQTGTVPGILPFGNGVDIDILFDGATATLLAVTPLSVLSIASGGTAATAPITIPPGFPGGGQPLMEVQAAILSPTLQVVETSDVFQF